MKQRIDKKLVLKKSTMANLHHEQLQALVGGITEAACPDRPTYWCAPNIVTERPTFKRTTTLPFTIITRIAC